MTKTYKPKTPEAKLREFCLWLRGLDREYAFRNLQFQYTFSTPLRWVWKKVF